MWHLGGQAVNTIQLRIFRCTTAQKESGGRLVHLEPEDFKTHHSQEGGEAVVNVCASPHLEVERPHGGTTRQTYLDIERGIVKAAGLDETGRAG